MENISTQVCAPLLALKLLRREGVLSALKGGPKSRKELFNCTSHLYENPSLIGYDLKKLEELRMIKTNLKICITPKGILYLQLKAITRPYFYVPILTKQTGRQRRVYLTKMHAKMVFELFYGEKLRTAEMGRESAHLDMSIKNIQKSLKDLIDVRLVERKRSVYDPRRWTYRLTLGESKGEGPIGERLAQTMQRYASAAQMVSRIMYVPKCTYTVNPKPLSKFPKELQGYVAQSRKNVESLVKVSFNIQNDELKLGREDYFPLGQITSHAAGICEQAGIKITPVNVRGSREGLKKVLDKEIAGCFVTLEALVERGGEEVAEAYSDTTVLYTFDWGVQNWWDQFLYVKESEEKELLAGYGDKSFFDKNVIHQYADKYKYKEVPLKDFDDSMERMAKGDLQARFGSKEPEGLFCEWIWKLCSKERIPSGTLVYIINKEILLERPKTTGFLLTTYAQAVHEFKRPEVLAANTLHYSTVINPKLTKYLRLAKRHLGTF